jgi:hypothetical protein
VPTLTTLPLAEKACWVIIISVNSSARSTVEASNEAGETFPAPPVPASFKLKAP